MTLFTAPQTLAIDGSPQWLGQPPQLHWLAERAAPIEGADPQADVFVTNGDGVILNGGHNGSEGRIVGAEGLSPVVEFTAGPYRGQTRVIDPDDIVAALLIRRALGNG